MRFLKLAPLVFVRPGELRHAEWVEIDFDTAEWRIPAEKMKAKTPHICPFVPAVFGCPEGNSAAYRPQ